jgi:hypothetical protein
MERDEDIVQLNPQDGGGATAYCACPTSESPVPVGVGAPCSRHQAVEGALYGRAGSQFHAGRCHPYNGAQACGPQYEVSPAASTKLQLECRPTYVLPKATSPQRGPKREGEVLRAGEYRARVVRCADIPRADGSEIASPAFDCIASTGRSATRANFPEARGIRSAASGRPLLIGVRKIRMYGLNWGVDSVTDLQA